MVDVNFCGCFIQQPFVASSNFQQKSQTMKSRVSLPPLTLLNAMQKVSLAGDACNIGEPDLMNHGPVDNRWRNYVRLTALGL